MPSPGGFSHAAIDICTNAVQILLRSPSPQPPTAFPSIPRPIVINFPTPQDTPRATIHTCINISKDLLTSHSPQAGSDLLFAQIIAAASRNTDTSNLIWPKEVGVSDSPRMGFVVFAANGAGGSTFSGWRSILGRLGGSESLTVINLITSALRLAALAADSFALDVASLLTQSSALSLLTLVW